MGISAAGAGTITAVAARQIASNSTQHVQQLQNDYHEDAIVEDSMYAQAFVGPSAIMARKSAGFAAMPDLKIAVTNRVVHGDQLTVEWVATGTHTSVYPGLPATGRSFSIPGITVVVRREGKIVRESLYYNMAEVERQLRAE